MPTDRPTAAPIEFPTEPPPPRGAPDLADRVSAWRAREGLSLERASQLLGVAHTTVRGWETGRRPGDLNLARVADLLGAPAGERRKPAALTLRQARVQQGLTLQQLARRLSVSVSTVSSWERGRRRPSCAVRAAVADELRLSAAEVAAVLPGWCSRAACCPARRSPSSPLRRLRQARGISRVDAARRLGISESRLARLETGSGTMNLVLYAAMARVYRSPFAVVAQAGGFDPHPLLDRRTWSSAPLHQVLVVLRTACGLSAAAVSRELAITARTLRRWEFGVAVPGHVPLRAMEARYGLAPGELQPLADRAHRSAHDFDPASANSGSRATALANSAIS